MLRVLVKPIYNFNSIKVQLKLYDEVIINVGEVISIP